MGERFLTVPEVARALRVAPVTIYRRIATGSLPAVRLGHGHAPLRVDAAELERWLYEVSPAGSNPPSPHQRAGAGDELGRATTAEPSSHLEEA